ncbi:L-threonylcarbamoyladenylate synthase [Pseudoblastomonas halimionae]|uniref:Threonylcarbamoyl-AMP synthase n=1 Tax=Alteriqipengyuania halimionae TaxID=1926630 RepID=A0A6I4U969_9SPHN|nr:L-threonylcarbamoyladenylate synthase [Alteriqipengyuania halimionae]MXP10861.1 threonylcarbamoyl-AMP synthase [Alteriqipengyuania halimionae]
MGSKDATEMLAANAAGIARAAEILRNGGLVALPTETVYGLAARADSAEAVAKIYEAKGRPSNNPLIVHCADLRQAEELGQFAPATRAAAQLWPGPLTLVVPLMQGADIAARVTAGLPTIALRVPAHPIMHAVIEAAGVPVAAPSANRSETVSPTTADHVVATLNGRIDAVLDGGATACGLESTILAIREDGVGEILRPGPIAAEDLLRIGVALREGRSTTIEAPGQLSRHYSPGKPVRLNAQEAEADEFLIGYGDVEGDFCLSSGNLEEAASRLYAALHDAARSPEPRIAVAPIPHEGIGAAINDRLRRAATE